MWRCTYGQATTAAAASVITSPPAIALAVHDHQQVNALAGGRREHGAAAGQDRLMRQPGRQLVVEPDIGGKAVHQTSLEARCSH